MTCHDSIGRLDGPSKGRKRIHLLSPFLMSWTASTLLREFSSATHLLTWSAPQWTTSKEWVALARDAGTRAGFVDIMASFVSSGGGGGERSDRTELERRRLSDHVERLEAFSRMGALVADDLRARRDALSSVGLAGDDRDGKVG